MDTKEAMGKLMETFGSQEGLKAHILITLSMSGQLCDVTFYRRKPILDVKIDQKIGIALMYGAGASKLQELLTRIRLSDGSVVSFNEIWIINPMPVGGFTKEELAAVDLSASEEKIGLFWFSGKMTQFRKR